MKDAELQHKLFEETIEESLNVKQLEEKVSKLLTPQPKKPKARRKAFSRDMRIAMNTIKESLNMVSKSGIGRRRRTRRLLPNHSENSEKEIVKALSF